MLFSRHTHIPHVLLRYLPGPPRRLLKGISHETNVRGRRRLLYNGANRRTDIVVALFVLIALKLTASLFAATQL
jgi:hypothetical protein